MSVAPRPCTIGEQLESGSARTGAVTDGLVCAGAPPATVTQTPPRPAAMSVTTFPTSIVATAAWRRGSIRVTVPSPALTTQTAPSPTAIRVGRVPTGIVAVTVFSFGSTSETVFESASVTQIDP